MAQNLPAAWQNEEQLSGLAIEDKRTLVGVPFRIVSLYFTEGTGRDDETVSYVYVEAERPTVDDSMEMFMFNDSSTGIRKQLVELLTARGLDAVVDSGERLNLSLVIPKGLRFSEYDTKDRAGHVVKNARTYYLSTNGKPATSAPEAATSETSQNSRSRKGRGATT
jgi:hypothetical protein